MPKRWVGQVEIKDYWDEGDEDSRSPAEVMNTILDMAFEYQDGFYVKVVGEATVEEFEDE